MGRKRKTKTIDGERCVLTKFTWSCSGCFESGDYMGNAHNYPFDSKAGCYVGAGCYECGYTGKRRVEMWIPERFDNLED